MKIKKQIMNKDNQKIKKKTGKPPRSSIEKRLLSYSIAAGAAITSVESAQAINIQPRTLEDVVNNTTYELDVNLDGMVDFTIDHASGSNPAYSIKSSGASGFGAIAGNGFLGKGFFADKLDPDAEIDESKNFIGRANFGSLYSYSGSANAYGNFLGMKMGFLGVKFSDVKGDTLFGWVRLSMPDDGSEITIHDLAYNEMAGGPIRAGQLTVDTPDGTAAVPEPGTLGMLALGAAGVISWRKRKEKAQSKI